MEQSRGPLRLRQTPPGVLGTALSSARRTVGLCIQQDSLLQNRREEVPIFLPALQENDKLEGQSLHRLSRVGIDLRAHWAKRWQIGFISCQSQLIESGCTTLLVRSPV